MPSQHQSYYKKKSKGQSKTIKRKAQQCKPIANAQLILAFSVAESVLERRTQTQNKQTILTLSQQYCVF